MKLGKVPTSELNTIDFNLPLNSSSNKDVLSKGKNHTEFYIGCGTPGDKKWIGKLYPEGIKERDFLKYYSGLFNVIYFIGFYYHLNPVTMVKHWKELVSPSFKFCPKFYYRALPTTAV